MLGVAEFKFEVVKTIGVLSVGAKGWRKELNMVSWNDKPAKLDIREWSPDREKMGKGVTLSDEEVKELKRLLDEID